MFTDLTASMSPIPKQKSTIPMVAVQPQAPQGSIPIKDPITLLASPHPAIVAPIATFGPPLDGGPSDLLEVNGPCGPGVAV